MTDNIISFKVFDRIGKCKNYENETEKNMPH